MSVTIDRAPADRIDAGRPIYVLTSVLILGAAIVGFAPRSIGILSETLPSPRLVVHLHAAVMLTWLVLLVTQSLLMATGRRRLHMRLGLVSFALAPAMAIMMIAAAIGTYRDLVAAGLAPGAANLLSTQIVIVALFGTLYGWAIWARLRAPETHKRLLLVASAMLLSAAAGRMPWLPLSVESLEEFNYMTFVYALSVLVPAVVHDVLRRGRVHHAYVVGIGVAALNIVAGMTLWNWPWWQRTALGIFGDT